MMKSSMKKKVAEIGFMAAARGWQKEAFEIFDGIEHLCPDSSVPFIGKALSVMSRENNDEAIAILSKGLERFPDDEELKAFLGFALHLVNETEESKKILERLVSSDTAIGRLARLILDEQRS